jgi:hypothetical protein
MGSTLLGCWTRQQRGPSDMGSGEHPIVEDDER